TNGERKKQGAYYTPEEVTKNIAEKTIYPYLLNNFKNILKRDYGWKETELAKYTKLQDMLNVEKPFTWNNDIWNSLLKSVQEVKIVDPACGSGHFLITCLNILSNIQKTILKFTRGKVDMFAIQSSIITNNLYGVDIDPIAVELTKLRLWLNLIGSMEIEEKDHIEKLPNVEYNIVQGDSLIGIDNIERLVDVMAVDPEVLATKLRHTAELINNYKTEKDPEKNEELRSEINRNIEELEKQANLRFEATKTAHKERGVPFLHWPLKFTSVFISDNPKFDIVIGNPPYGDLLDENDKKYVQQYTSSLNEIAGAFVDRMIPMLKEGGNLGYILTYAITFSKDLSGTRSNLLNKFKKTTILTFDRDKCKIFSEMTQSVSFLFAENRSSTATEGRIYTSRFHRTKPDKFECAVHDINGMVLFEKSSSSNLNQRHRLPKIGDDITYEILSQLKSHSVTIKNIISVNGKEVWYRSSGNYWYNAWNYEPYKSSKIKSIKIDGEYYDLFLVIMNSTLFYLYFRVYGDGRDMNMDIMQSFPLPAEDKITKYKDELSICANDIINALKQNFDSERNRFLTSKVKKYIDECDRLLAKLYDFTPDQLDYILNYDKEVRETVEE
ncbi:MAG: N-6 DNA methylase, partial [Thermoplasmatales archaeon]